MNSGRQGAEHQTRCMVNNPEDCFGPCVCGERSELDAQYLSWEQNAELSCGKPPASPSADNVSPKPNDASGPQGTAIASATKGATS